MSSDAGRCARFDALCRRAQALGLAVRGAFHPEPREFDAVLPGIAVGTIMLLGFTASHQWEFFRCSAEASDGKPDPLDRWSRRIVGLLAAEFGAIELYPNGRAPQLPFQRLAARCEPVHQSPIGLLIHAHWGLWHAYRGALVLPDRIDLPGVAPSRDPCAGCAAKPCLSACPVAAFRSGSFDVEACVNHVRSGAGVDCREHGCLARRACPVGAQFRYAQDQARFHMQAFLRAAPP
ncbi:MAG: ferredoxin [Steroidobacteraceae bacterium]|jgi:hypothetical protein